MALEAGQESTIHDGSVQTRKATEKKVRSSKAKEKAG